jgi:hypothetical protein
MTSETDKEVIVPDAASQRAIRKWIYLRAVLLGALVAAWWIFFAPDSLMEYRLKIILGIAAGLIASGSYLYNLRKTLLPETAGK